MTTLRDRERQLTREISRRVQHGLPGVEVLAVEMAGPDRFTVYIDRAQGVDHVLCERVTNELRDYLRDFSVEVSSPGIERPLRTPAHFRAVVGRRVALRTEAPGIDGRTRFRGEVKRAGETDLTLGVDGGDVDIPYGEIVRGNLIDEGTK